MPLAREPDGTWRLEPREEDATEIEQSHASYLEALPRYLTLLDPAFERAKGKSEFNFLLSLLAIRGMQDAGWDPYETTLRAVDAIRNVHHKIKADDDEASRHLTLWIYGHMVEASEPYELLSNLLDVAVGGGFKISRFPSEGAPVSPGKKIDRLEAQARAAGVVPAALPMKEAWNREFRNAIFHADYSLYGAEVRTMRPTRSYSQDQVLTLVNRAMAAHEAMAILRRYHFESYEEPVRIPADPRVVNAEGEIAMVIVREGYGAVGLKDAWSREDLHHGCIPYRMGRFAADEIALLDADHDLALLPRRETP